jgi:5'-nucleotidase
MTLTGAQVKGILEQQFAGVAGQGANRILQVSAGLTYTRSFSGSAENRISELALNGTPIDPAATYRVAVDEFLADGGDGFSRITAGVGRQVSPTLDLEALTAYLAAHPNLAPPSLHQVTIVP